MERQIKCTVIGDGSVGKTLLTIELNPIDDAYTIEGFSKINIENITAEINTLKDLFIKLVKYRNANLSESNVKKGDRIFSRVYTDMCELFKAYKLMVATYKDENVILSEISKMIACSYSNHCQLANVMTNDEWLDYYERYNIIRKILGPSSVPKKAKIRKDLIGKVSGY